MSIRPYAAGEKLRVIYQTAVPNISVAIGKSLDLSPSQIKNTETVDYILGGSLTLRNGRIDQYQFEEGYCQASASSSQTNADSFIFYYYDQDHLGNIRQVTKANKSKTGTVIQTNNYYPFGAEFCDNSSKSYVQKHKYNGKEFDNMHGLNTYDYGARQYNPVTARWDRIDPLAEKFYSTSPYVYCMNNPVMLVDPDGCKPDSLAAAMMSALAYKSNSEYSKDLAKKGWQEYHSYSSNTGFKSKMFRKEIGKDKKGNAKYEYCLAFAGTDTDNGLKEFLKDGATDYLNAIGVPTFQYAEAFGAALGSSSGMAKKSELTFVGHSLGGGLATLASKSTGKNAIIFNPASINGTIKTVANIASLFRGGDITQYRAYGDYVNAAQDIGRIPSSGNVHWVNTGSIISHGIDDIIKTFKGK